MWVDLPHKVIWRRRNFGNEWEGDTHAAPQTIPARVERRTRVRQTDTGDVRVDETRIMVGADHPVSTDDTLDEERIEATDEQVNLSGEVTGYICYVESSRGI